MKWARKRQWPPRHYSHITPAAIRLAFVSPADTAVLYWGHASTSRDDVNALPFRTQQRARFRRRVMTDRRGPEGIDHDDSHDVPAMLPGSRPPAPSVSSTSPATRSSSAPWTPRHAPSPPAQPLIPGRSSDPRSRAHAVRMPVWSPPFASPHTKNQGLPGEAHADIRCHSFHGIVQS